MDQARTIRVDVWADMVCPWCFIGMRRLESAIADAPSDVGVEVVHHAFQLDPGATNEGARTVDVLAEKYGISTEQAVDMMSDVSDTAADVGLRYNLGATISGNTTDAHRLVLWAQDQGRGTELLEALFTAYFEGAEPVFTPAELLPIVARTGLDDTAAAVMLAGDDYREHVIADQQLAAQVGARGVPFFVFDGKRGVSGAQPADVFRRALLGT